jgi:hypothetical protein
VIKDVPRSVLDRDERGGGEDTHLGLDWLVVFRVSLHDKVQHGLLVLVLQQSMDDERQSLVAVIKDVPRSVLDRDERLPFIVHGLLQHEHKQSVLQRRG